MSARLPHETGAKRAARREAGRRAELRSYLTGFALAVLLTALPFSLVAAGLDGRWVLTAIGLAALAQIVVHFRFFLHISLDRSTRDDLQLILFTSLIIALMAGGTIWILGNLHERMM
ncbi:cytochrome o ubiquinol oxidase subunit IV [Aureimonas jatrophae]|jgi:cytochrome o ubiquinol oxidase subunit IV|uniref:Cytochrome bo(3) ubiquinol oxidase subunit 4 n=1 Tax=Aureimonas jatrophae TaxID=1166073 RepID=A0A1H0DK20_9HYPH|nr:cytochrome o ubiquinol oxidase subunit IV [Aureimonas jatrophae]MBB3951934.1 cytochrome o ubiquinol oxidase operon protein cyoD [Aureimonas jatrophae]SDN70399.1 cytochrome o ubiquinol oxidase operon protein cyoD [Aureimonas jatrophae]